MKETIKKGIIFGISAGLTILLFGITYAVWSPLSTEISGNTLTAEKWNIIINRLNSIDKKSLVTAWVNFDGRNCTGGIGGNECVLKDSYNINKVIKISVGKYSIEFLNTMDNGNYSYSGNVDNYNYGFYRNSITFANAGINSIQVANFNEGLETFHDDVVSVQIFGGKNY